MVTPTHCHSTIPKILFDLYLHRVVLQFHDSCQQELDNLHMTSMLLVLALAALLPVAGLQGSSVAWLLLWLNT